MLASLSSFYENIRSFSFSGRKAGDKRRRERYFTLSCLDLCLFLGKILNHVWIFKVEYIVAIYIQADVIVKNDEHSGTF